MCDCGDIDQKVLIFLQFQRCPQGKKQRKSLYFCQQLLDNSSTLDFGYTNGKRKSRFQKYLVTEFFQDVVVELEQFERTTDFVNTCELLVIASNLPPPPIYPPLHIIIQQ
jgi:hypothetical protein